jgi:hypothetical protein
MITLSVPPSWNQRSLEWNPLVTLNWDTRLTLRIDVGAGANKCTGRGDKSEPAAISLWSPKNIVHVLCVHIFNIADDLPALYDKKHRVLIGVNTAIIEFHLR